MVHNTNGLSPTSSLALENTTGTGVAVGGVARLRINIAVATTSLATGTQFKLQYQANATSGAWSDVGLTASSTAWRGYDNTHASTTDGETIPYTYSLTPVFQNPTKNKILPLVRR